MLNFVISVKKVTDENLMREACEMTFNGKSHQSLINMYKSEHSPTRTQLFWVKCEGIPLFVSTHLLRHHVGSTPFQLTCRDDRNGGNNNFKAKMDEVIKALSLESYDSNQICIRNLEEIRDNSDRYTPVNLGLFLNAQSLIDMAKLRLCNMAHEETRKVFQAIKDEVAKVDPELAEMMVRKCVYRNGLCGESNCCGFNNTIPFRRELEDYYKNFKKYQIGK